jgi:rRNA maturation RNase YbeY
MTLRRGIKQIPRHQELYKKDFVFVNPDSMGSKSQRIGRFLSTDFRRSLILSARLRRRLASSAPKRYYAPMPVEVLRRGGGKKYPARRLKAVAARILELLKQERAELSVALIGNGEMRKLNARYRKKNYPTDVLSFPAGAAAPGGIRLLGDVIISVDKAKEQAKERSRTLDEEMTTLLIHGVLHLLGFDHEGSATDARIMGRLERKLYRELCAGGLLKV